jgi:hypothetical protein
VDSSTVVAAAFSGAAVAALINVVGNLWISRRTFTHQRDLADSQHEADRQLASDARFFEHRSKVYLDAVGLLSEMRQAMWNYPNDEEESRQLRERFGSAAPRELVARLNVFAPQAADLFAQDLPQR